MHHRKLVASEKQDVVSIGTVSDCACCAPIERVGSGKLATQLLLERASVPRIGDWSPGVEPFNRTEIRRHAVRMASSRGEEEAREERPDATPLRRCWLFSVNSS